MAEEYNPMQSNVSAVERAKKKTPEKVRKKAGRAVTTDPNAAPAKEPTRVQGPKPLTRPSDVDLSTGRPKQVPKAPTVTKQAPRPKAPEAGRIQQVKPGGLTEAEMNVKAPGYYRKGRYMTKPPPKPPKKYAAPESAFKGKAPGETQRAAQTKAKAAPSYWQRVKAYATRNEPGPGPESTIETRLGSIGKLSKKTFPGKASKQGGILNIQTEAAKGRGPALEAQAETPAASKRRGALSLLEKQRKGMRVTGADVPSHGKDPVTPTGDKRTKVEVLEGPRKATKEKPGHLGSYKVTGIPAPKPKRKKVAKKKGYQPPARAETIGEIWSGFWGKKKK